jgi:hypothetical protein
MSHTIRVRAIAFMAAASLAGSAWGAFAQASTPNKSAKMPAASSKASHSVSGTLEKFDATGKMLTVHTSKGSETLALSSDARIREGSHSLTAADLSSHTGSRVRVSYTERDGQKTAQEVRLSQKAPANPAAKPKKQE